MIPSTEPALAPLRPSLIASALDVFPHVPSDQRRQPRMFMKIALALGAEPAEAAGVHLRLRATETLFADPRWQAWRHYFRNADRSRWFEFDGLVIALIATMPMTGAADFIADDFFDALLERVGAHSHS